MKQSELRRKAPMKQRQPVSPASLAQRKKVAGSWWCIGCGEHTERCGKPSDLELNSSGLWCTRCENLRRESITAQMAKVTASFEELSRGS